MRLGGPRSSIFEYRPGKYRYGTLPKKPVALEKLRCALRAHRSRDAVERSKQPAQPFASARVRKTADSGSKKRPAPAETTAEQKTQLLASNAAVTDADLDSILPDEGYETLPPPKQDAEPKG